MSTAERYAAIVADLAAVSAAATDGERIESLTRLERIKSAAAAQARLTDSFAVSQREKLIKAGARSQDASRSITAQVALARRDSPHQGDPARRPGRDPGARDAGRAGRPSGGVRPASGGAPSSPGRPRT
ncbi:MAG TPA: hypothetical protein VIU11_09010 [Nakamurella sp.]